MQETSIDNDIFNFTVFPVYNYDILLSLWKKYIKQIGYMQKIKLFKKIHLENVKLDKWEESQPFYAFICPKHGFQVNYPMGWKKKLIYPQCFEEGYDK